MSGKPAVAPLGVVVEKATWWPRTRVTPVFADVSLAIEPGQRVLLTGPNGCGKTVLLNGIHGAVPDPAAGEWRGSITLTEPGPTDASSSPVDLAAPQGRVTKKALKAAFAAVGLRGLDPSVIDERVSGGQGQLVRIARQLAGAPALLVFDEPVSMLDPGAVATAATAIGAAAVRTGATLVVAAHRLSPWISHVDRIIVMDASGRIIADGPTAQVLNRHTEALLAAGIWVPGRPDPTPQAIGIAWDAPAVERRAVIARAESVTVRHNDADLVAEGLPGLRREVTAIRDGDLDLLSGQCVALVGPTGAGGSSWLSALAGIVAADDGTISWSGAAMHVDNAERGGRLPDPHLSRAGADPDVDDPPAGMPSVPSVVPHQLTSRDLVRALGWMPQDPSSTVLGATVRDDLLTTALAAGLAPEIAARRADVLLDALGLTRLAAADPRTLSSGESRRLSLAGAVIHQPALLLADQPTIEQDRHGWAAITGILESLRAAGSAVLVTTHDGGLTPYADRIVGVRPPRVSAGKSAHARPDARAATEADLVVVAPVGDAPADGSPEVTGTGAPAGPARGDAHGDEGAAPAAMPVSASSVAAVEAPTSEVSPVGVPAPAPLPAPAPTPEPAPAPAPASASASASPGTARDRVGPSEAPLAAARPAASPELPSPVRADRSTSFGSPSYREALGLWWVAFILVCGVFGFAGFVHFFGGAGLQDAAASALWWAGLAMGLLLGGRAIRAWWRSRARTAARTVVRPSAAATANPASSSTGPPASRASGDADEPAGSEVVQGNADALESGDAAQPRRIDTEPGGMAGSTRRDLNAGVMRPDEQARRLRGLGDRVDPGDGDAE